MSCSSTHPAPGPDPGGYLICPVCTYHNSLSQIQCLICQSPILTERRISSEKETLICEMTDDNIECPHCTFRNSKGVKHCEACAGTLKRKRNDSPDEIFDRELRLNYPSHLLTVDSEEKVFQVQPQASVTEGIIPLIREVLEEDQSLKAFRLCSATCPHVSQKKVSVGGDWSCGYRNIQMICHSLMALPSYRRALFNGSGEVPDVQGLQAWVDKAWASGFDREVNSSSFSPHNFARVAFNLAAQSSERRLGLVQQVSSALRPSPYPSLLSRVCCFVEVHEDSMPSC
jgi:hypothetical protein